jgi:putative hydrolase of the HAD superfamily
MPSIRAILFDADGVIQHSTSDDLPVRLEHILGFIPDRLDTFMHEVFEAERPALAGQADFADMLAPVLTRWGAAGAAAQLASAWWCSIAVDQAILALIKGLRQQGIFCALASNQQRYRATYMAQTLTYDAVFDRSFYSYQLGFVKPDLRYFEAIMASLPFAPGEMLFIDDAEKNVAAARRAGLQAAQFIHPRTSHAASTMTKLLEGFSVGASE